MSNRSFGKGLRHTQWAYVLSSISPLLGFFLEKGKNTMEKSPPIFDIVSAFAIASIPLMVSIDAKLHRVLHKWKDRSLHQTKSYFRQINPCNARRKTSGVGLLLRKKEKSFWKSLRILLTFRTMNIFWLTCRAQIIWICFLKHHQHFDNFAVPGSVFRINPTLNRSLLTEFVG